MKTFNVLLQYLIPQHMLSRLISFFANCRYPWFKNRFIRWFIKRYPVNMEEAEERNPLNYTTFNNFFVRKLRKEVRPIIDEIDAIISPVDGVISQIGEIEHDRILHAKGVQYSLEALLAGKYVEEFKNGQFVTLYLSPKDYHRVHMPFTGTLCEMIYVPGRLFSVNPQVVMSVPDVFARNERVICIFETSVGLMGVVMVGAMLVAGIRMTWAGKITPNKDCQLHYWQYPADLVKLSRGLEMGLFEFGSTVLVLFQAEKVAWNQTLDSGIRLRISVLCNFFVYLNVCRDIYHRVKQNRFVSGILLDLHQSQLLSSHD